MTRRESIPEQVRHAVDDALQLLQHEKWHAYANDDSRPPDPLPSLLDQCGALASQAQRQEPVRLIHHFACTGGTLITKCLACSPNVQVLSEVDPLSTMLAQKSKFNPTDLTQILQHGNRGASIEDKLAMFRATFDVLYDTAVTKGLRMLVRGHAHSHFCTGDAIESRPTLGQILGQHYETRSIITVRHPLDSWLSLTKNGWITFQPNTLEEYCGRYHAFLDAYPDTPCFKYEDFVADQSGELSIMCDKLRLPYPSEFQSLFMAHSFSGDSGRKGDVIKARDRRHVPEDLEEQIKESPSFRSLCRRLQYQV